MSLPAVAFAPLGGRGVIAVATPNTDSAGVATPGAWTLGDSTGAHLIRAALAGGSAGGLAASPCRAR